MHEDAIKVGLDTYAPDYSFRIGGVVRQNPEAEQALRYELGLRPAV